MGSYLANSMHEDTYSSKKLQISCAGDGGVQGVERGVEKGWKYAEITDKIKRRGIKWY